MVQKGLCPAQRAEWAANLVGVIDPTDPAVIDVHDFRRAGESKRVERDVVIHEALGNPVIGVPQGAQVDLQILLESVIDGVLVTAEAVYPFEGQCSRCLDPISGQRSTEFSQLFLWSEPEQADEEHLPLIDQGFVDLTGELQDAIGLDLPLAPVCREDCPGLCPRCGARLAEAGPEHHHEEIDPRWAALSGLELDTDADDE